MEEEPVDVGEVEDCSEISLSPSLHLPNTYTHLLLEGIHTVEHRCMHTVGQHSHPVASSPEMRKMLTTVVLLMQ
jgi:hypothetical protein